MATLARCLPLLGTYVEIEITADVSRQTLINLSNVGFNIITRIEKLMSFHDANSELSILNKKANNQPVAIQEHTYKVLSFALELASKSNGLFDPTVAPQLIKQGLLPNHNWKKSTYDGNWQDINLKKDSVCYRRPLVIDLGGIAKGYAVDVALLAIQQKFPTASVKINAGGDLVYSQWQNEIVYIRKPGIIKRLIATKMLNSALATSSYENRKKPTFFIINPLTKKPIPLPYTVSVFSSSCMLSDALTKIVALDKTSKLCQEYQAEVIISK